MPITFRDYRARVSATPLQLSLVIAEQMNMYMGICVFVWGEQDCVCVWWSIRRGTYDVALSVRVRTVGWTAQKLRVFDLDRDCGFDDVHGLAKSEIGPRYVLYAISEAVMPYIFLEVRHTPRREASPERERVRERRERNDVLIGHYGN